MAVVMYILIGVGFDLTVSPHDDPYIAEPYQVLMWPVAVVIIIGKGSLTG